VYKRQIYHIAESNRIEKIDSVARIESNRNFFLPELECSSRQSSLVSRVRSFCRGMSQLRKISLCSATTYADNVALPAFARRCCCGVQQSTDISCRLGPQQQTCSSGYAAVSPRWDRRMVTVPFYNPCSCINGILPCIRNLTVEVYSHAVQYIAHGAVLININFKLRMLLCTYSMYKAVTCNWSPQ